MGSLNKVLLIGRLGGDPEVRYTQSGQAVANFTLATEERWKSKDGEKQSRVEWHRCVAWGRQAEIAGEYLGKGRQVYVEGRNQTREWEDKEGNTHRTTEVVVNNIQFLGRKDDGNNNKANNAQSTPEDDGVVADDDPRF